MTSTSLAERGLLRALLAHARASAFAQRLPLQLALELIYRLLERDYRDVEAYLYLAYFCCLLQDDARALQILLHAEQLQPGDARLQAMLTQVRFSLQQPLPAETSGNRPAPARLPQLNVLRQQLAFSQDDLPERFAALRPILKQLDQRIQELP